MQLYCMTLHKPRHAVLSLGSGSSWRPPGDPGHGRPSNTRPYGTTLPRRPSCLPRMNVHPSLGLGAPLATRLAAKPGRPFVLVCLQLMFRHYTHRMGTSTLTPHLEPSLGGHASSGTSCKPKVSQ